MVYPVEQSKVGWLPLKLCLKTQLAVCSHSRRIEISLATISTTTGWAARQSQLSYVIEAQLESSLSTIKFSIAELGGKVWLNDPATSVVVSFFLCLLSNCMQFMIGRARVYLPDCCILFSIKLENNVKWVSSVRILTTVQDESRIPYNAAKYAWCLSSPALCTDPVVKECSDLMVSVKYFWESPWASVLSEFQMSSDLLM